MVDLRKAAAIVGIYEHPARFAPDKSELLVQAESVIGALADAGLEKKDVDGLFSSSMSVRMANVSLWPTIWTSTPSTWTTRASAALPSSSTWATPSTPLLRGASMLP